MKILKGRTHWIENLVRRLVYGVGCCDLYGYNYYISKIIARDLRRFQAKNCSYPMGMSEDEWNSMLEDMAKGFEATELIDECFETRELKRLVRERNKGLKLFAKYFNDLWM